MMTPKVLILIFILGVIVTIFSSACFSFDIIEPKAGSVFRPGDQVLVKVGTKSNEKLIGVWFGTLKLHESEIDFIPPYEFKFTISQEFVGTETIVAIAKSQDSTAIESRVDIKVALPSSVVLEKILVRAKKIYLWKVPAGTKGSQSYEQEQLDVDGLFSDGIVRDISSSSAGTRYVVSNNENIITVDSEGLVTAIAIGKAQIIIKNGNKQEAVDVSVKQKPLRKS